MGVRCGLGVGMALKFLLFESSSGYALFERDESEEIGELTPEVLQSIGEFTKFNKLVDLKAFSPYTSAENALENLNDVTEGILNDSLKAFLETQGLAKSKGSKKSKVQLGVSDPKLGGAIKEALSIDCVSNEQVLELMRGIRLHFAKFIKGLDQGDLERSQVGLGHSYSRSKVKFNIHRSDNMIIKAIAVLDQLDKDVNTFAMRIKEWYSWHFPELAKIVTDMRTYVKVTNLIQNKKSLSAAEGGEEKQAKLLDLLDGDKDLTKTIVAASKASMGADLSEIDMINVSVFSDRVLGLIEYRKSLSGYLQERMNAVAPNLTALIGEQVGARLISKAGSLTNLSKAPASTVQILGAEKALFRALKTKGNTPKYGLIYHSTFIGRASAKNKGRISRYLANKCSIASRIDCFSDVATDEFGKKLREQVEERLEFFNSGTVPRKNVDCMQEVVRSLKEAEAEHDEEEKPKKKRKAEAVEEEEASSKKSKDKKKKKEAEAEEEVAETKHKAKKQKKDKEAADEMVDDEDGASKKKKKKAKN
eukprot:c39154_g1_i1.p1 GENE.c39154_g1_i1~~c39154_g1_i1.p1  ORF type:complete len:534 (-),score=173.96 c39154_g1_i1:137-1738(-)